MITYEYELVKSDKPCKKSLYNKIHIKKLEKELRNLTRAIYKECGKSGRVLPQVKKIAGSIKHYKKTDVMVYHKKHSKFSWFRAFFRYLFKLFHCGGH